MAESSRAQRNSAWDKSAVPEYTPIPVETWFEDSLADDSEWLGIEFWETSDAPVGNGGVELISASCVQLEKLCDYLCERGYDLDRVIPYVRFRLPDSDELLSWTPAVWQQISAKNAAFEIVKDGAVFYWGVFESHHETLPVPGNSSFCAIFRRSKGFDDGEPWSAFQNELLIIPDADWRARMSANTASANAEM